ncbi:trypsin-like peptidase domain-containing protein [Streptomyces sp. NBC_00047]|uniref:trypsin-like peptidase domain-containing protein n=1 Tax=Streptomyces sp. NBC_00047 TaxID=2975627 RepID=UPI0022537230|nr:trypsin-like peptidase domain-containing protein [Streptomyces sp. NBC_00047]MCX5613069.1 trypsin-like peptidase domain-containing protein [Streptomyces sp. NBC_00047]
MADVRVAAIRCEGRQGAAPTFGSGYLITDRLMLTAAHVVRAANGVRGGVTARIGGQICFGTVVWLAAGTDGHDDGLDAAVVDIDDPSYRPTPLPPMRWGWVAGRSTGVACSATGFPDSVVDAKNRAEQEQIHGTINPLSRERRGMLDIVPTSWPQRRPGGPTLWSGMSGAGLLSASGQLLIGVVIEVPAHFEDRRLTAMPLSALRTDPSFLDLVERHRGTPLWLEPVELEPILRPWRRPDTPQSPVALLRPEHEVVPFHGRTHTMAHLMAWCGTGPQALGLLIHAPGGTGKTRLARELARVMHRKGWIVGEVSDSAADFGVLTQAASPLLLLIDYAETRVEATASLLRFLSERGGQHPVRVLLLARSAGQWWDTLLQDEQVAAILPDPPYPLGGVEYVFDTSEQLAILTNALRAGLARVPGYEEHDSDLAALELPWHMVRSDTHHPLSLHIAVLASLLAQRDDVAGQSQPEKILLRHEKRYWNRLAAERSIRFPETRELVLIFCLLCGARSKAEALETVALLPGFRSEALEDGRRVLAHWIASLYPPADPRTDYWGLLTPDWLFEYLLAETLQDEPELLENLTRTNKKGSASQLTGAQLYRALTVLTAAAAHPTPAAHRLRFTLGMLVAVHNGLLPPIAVAVSVHALDPSPLLAALSTLVQAELAEVGHLQRLRTSLPPVPGRLAPVGLALQQRVVALLRSGEQSEELGLQLAEELTLLGTYLAVNGKTEEAASASAEAVELFTAHGPAAGRQPTSYLNALSNHAVNLAGKGEWDASYRAASQVIELAGQHPANAETNRSLVGALSALFLHHSHLGEFGEAKSVLSRAVAMQRQAVSSQSGGHGFDWQNLGLLLLNQADWLASQGEREEEVRVRTEGVDIFRRLYRASSGVYANHFQRCAFTLADVLGKERRHAEAASLYGEAGEALSRLWNEDTRTYQLKLGITLVLQAGELGLAGAPAASVVHVLARSCGVLRRLFRKDPAASARHYMLALKPFIQHAQRVDADFDIRPYMSEVAKALDYVVSGWEAAGQIPGDDDMTVDLTLFVGWAAESGLRATAVGLCERVECLLRDEQSDDRGLFNHQALLVTLVMWRAKALARMGEHARATTAAREGVGALTAEGTQENQWSAYVAADALHDVARHLAHAEADEESLELSRLGVSLGKTHLSSARKDWAQLLCNHLIHAAVLEARRGNHARAAALLEDALPLTRWLTQHFDTPHEQPLIGFAIVQELQEPRFADSLDNVLSLYAQELRELDRREDLGPALAERVTVRSDLHEAEPSRERALACAWAGMEYAQHLQETERPEQAAAAARSSLAAVEPWTYADEDHQGIRAMVFHENALVLAHTGFPDDALEAVAKSVSLYKALHPDGRPNPYVATVVDNMSVILFKTERQEEGLGLNEEALDIWRALATEDPSKTEALAICLNNRIVTLVQLGRTEEASALLPEYDALVGHLSDDSNEATEPDPTG